LTNVGAALEQIGWQPGRHRGRQCERLERNTAFDRTLHHGPRAASEQHGQRVFLLRQLLLEDRQQRLGRQRFGLDLPQLELRSLARVVAHALQALRFAPCLDRTSRDFGLRVERAQREIAVHHIGDERELHRIACRCAREQIAARGFRRAAIFAPEIDLPRSVQRDGDVVELSRNAGEEVAAALGYPVASCRRAGRHARQAVGACDGKSGARFIDARGRHS
jgi:hypothetical protein